MKNFRPDQVVRFTAERGGVEREYEVILRKPTKHTPRHWGATYKGKHVVVCFHKNEDFVNKMWTFRGTGVTTICQYGVIHA